MTSLTLTGRVERGEGIATGLGCPTANLAVEQGLIIPALGVYVAETEVEGKRFHSVVCVNDGRTGNNLKLEVHLLDVQRDLQGKQLTVRLLNRTRDLVPWEGEDHMRNLIAKDLSDARNWFDTHTSALAS